ncbi:MAG: hypothetical protein M1821_006596 [Bathelium mastoideum]|nr:MAG: hypothetical protein M1821_006596 [Bathelium mastoideum]
MTTNFNSSGFTEVPATAPAEYPKKRIIVCCDGTWQASNHGTANIPSNVAKISRAVASFEKTASGEFIHQVVYYHAGVGTATDTVKNAGFIQDQIATLVKKWEGGVGAGLDENVCEAYNFIVNNYNPGDELYFFGFSRGAYTARATAGLVASVGVCTNPMMDSFYRMYSAYRLKDADQPLEDTEWGKSDDGRLWFDRVHQQPTIKVVGVFDTVGALGYPDTGKIDVTKWNKAFGFHNTNLHPEIEYAFHVLALDEHRRPFSPTLWSLPPPVEGQSQTKKLIQCWFPGMHINIGGGSSDVLEEEKQHLTDMESMANITYAWMVDRVRENTGLLFNEDAIRDIVFRYSDAVYAVENADDTRKGGRAYQGWGMGPVADSFENMKAGGSMTRTPGHYPEKGVTHEYIHPVVAYAKRSDAQSKYNSPALEGFVRTKRTDPNNAGYSWVKTYTEPQEKGKGSWVPSFSYFFGKPTKPEGNKVVVEIPEFVIPGDDDAHKNIERWLMTSSSQHRQQGFAPTGSEEEKLHFEREKVFEATREFIQQLDKDNNIEQWVPKFDTSGETGFTQGGFQSAKE